MSRRNCLPPTFDHHSLIGPSVIAVLLAHTCCLLPADYTYTSWFLCSWRVYAPILVLVRASIPSPLVFIVCYPCLSATVAVAPSHIISMYNPEGPFYTTFPYWPYQNECNKQSY